MAIATPLHQSPPPLSITPCRASPPPNPYLRFPSARLLPRSPAAHRATATPPPTPLAACGDEDDALPDPEKRKNPLDLAPLLVATAVAAAANQHAALASSGGSMGGCSGSDSFSTSFSSSPSWGNKDSTSSLSRFSSSSSSPKKEAEATHESIGTAAPSPVAASPDMRFWGNLALASSGAVALFFLAVRNYTPPRTTTAVVKLQVDEKDRVGSWKEHFNKISIDERSKFDEETLSNLEGIKRKKSYSKKTDGSRNEYIVLTILVAADGTPKFPDVIRSSADLEAVVEKLNSTRERELWGVHVLWTPQDKDDVLSEERIQEDYPYLIPLRT